MKRISILCFRIVFVCQILFFKGFSQHSQRFSNSKAKELFDIIRSESAANLERALEKGENPNDTLDGYSALMAATLSGTIEQMKILIQHGASVNYLTSTGISTLWLAIPDYQKTSLLLEHGADIQHKIGGYNILAKLATIPGTIKLFRLIMNKGIDLKSSTPDNSLMFDAASSGDTALLGLLIRSGLKVNDTTLSGDYPLDGALFFRNFSTVKMLIDSGSEINEMCFIDETDKFTPLMIACLYNDKLSFFYLLNHGANVNLKTKKGFTALILLQQSELDDPSMTLSLINHGANPLEKADDGTDALYYAQEKGNTQSVVILKRYANK